MFATDLEKNSSYFLMPEEQREIRHRVKLAVSNILIKMAFVGGLANIISGLFFVWMLYGTTNTSVLLGWYAVLVVANLGDMVLCQFFKNKITNPSSYVIWRRWLIFLFIVICLTWGSVTFLFFDSRNELGILAFLLAVLIGFSLPSISDFKLAIVSLSGLLAPSIIFYLTYAAHLWSTPGPELNKSLSIGVSFFILGLFLLAVTAISSRLVNRFFHLTFTNAVLNSKLENINKFLEERVKERTIELQKTLDQVTYQATHDLLTNLPNQRSLISYMESAIKLARQNNQMFAVVFFSLNELERIYNALGYQAGDTVLKTIANRLQEAYPEPPTDDIKDSNYIVALARNNAFVVIIQSLESIEELEEKVQPLFKMVEKSVVTEKQVLKLTTSLGASIFPRNGRNITSLLMNADAAMLLAKQSGGNDFVMYKSEINAAISKQLELESKLHSALIKSEFLLQYQPLVNLQDGSIKGAEALVRWENPTLGRIPPDSFIPLAEANGIIIPLGEWVFRLACNTIKDWHDLGFKDLKIAVNLSAKQLQYRYLTRVFAKILSENDISPQFIELELTESFAFRNETRHILKDLKAMGFSIAIDDFGTGYSGLSSLKLLDIDKIKIDKSFIQDVVTNSDSQAIVSNTIALARVIDVKVVAEGVETKEQLQFLVDHGCDYVQGFYFSPPVDQEVFSSLLQNVKKFNV